MADAKHLAVPIAQHARYKRNFVRQVVCELRFPTLFELEGPKPPLPFASALRKVYPVYEHINGLQVNVGNVASSHGHMFKSNRNSWAVTMRASSVTLECTTYERFDDLLERLSLIIQSVTNVIDSDYFTRVGLRYINAVPLPSADEVVGDWIRPELVGGIDGPFGDVSEFSHRVAGFVENGSYLFQHGYGGTNENTEYVLDYDFAQQDVAIGDVIKVLPNLHARLFDLFDWSLGHKAKEFLGPSSI